MSREGSSALMVEAPQTRQEGCSIVGQFGGRMNVYKRLRWQGYGGTCVYGRLEFLSRPWQVGRRWGQQPGRALSYTSGLAWYPVSCPGGFPSRGFSAWRWHCWCVRSCWWRRALLGVGPLLVRLHPSSGVDPRLMLRTLGQSGQASGRLAPWVSGGTGGGCGAGRLSCR